MERNKTQIDVEEVDSSEVPDPVSEQQTLQQALTLNDENTSRRPGRTPRSRKSTFVLDSQFVHAKDFATPSTFLNAMLIKQIRGEGGGLDSFGAEIFDKIKVEYDTKLHDPFKQKIEKGELDKVFPADGVTCDISEINRKLAIQDTKRNLEKQIFNLRMKHNAMLKGEYDTKLKMLQDKWAEIEQGVGNEPLAQEDIEQMVGLVNNKVKVKTLHEMIKEKTKEDYQIEEQHAKEFIREMK